MEIEAPRINLAPRGRVAENCELQRDVDSSSGQPFPREIDRREDFLEHGRIPIPDI
jgi:hypothetical protein